MGLQSLSAPAMVVACRRNTAKAAYGAVEIPEGVIDLLTGLRDYLQDKCEPPVYVSDRRFMKSIQMLQVAAYADGRDSVSAAFRPSSNSGPGTTCFCHLITNCPVQARECHSRVTDACSSSLWADAFRHGCQDCPSLCAGA